MKTICTLILLMLSIFCNAQLKINGVVQNSNFEPATHAKITNLSTNKFSYADDDGNYTIDAITGDSIIASSIGYWPISWVVPNGFGNIHKNFVLPLKSKNIGEVHIKSLSKYQLDSMVRANDNAKIQSINTKESYQSPVSAVYKMFSKKYKDISKLQTQIKDNEKQKYINTKYNIKIVNELTKLQGDTAAMFINANPMEYDYARIASDLEIKMWIKEKYRESLQQAKTLQTSKEN